MKLNQHIGPPFLTFPSLSPIFVGPPRKANPLLPAIRTPAIILVPYCAHHVPTYHRWMQSPALQNATASEPLSLAEEYAMQRSWRTDGDKLTFIVCLPRGGSWDGGSAVEAGSGEEEEEEEVRRMVGDVNLFLSVEDGKEGSVVVVGEVEIMIARADVQGKGKGFAALTAFLWYVLREREAITEEFAKSLGHVRGEEMRWEYLRVKIGATNARSIGLFEKVGFRKVAEEANYFGELELRMQVTEESERKLAIHIKEAANGEGGWPVVQEFSANAEP